MPFWRYVGGQICKRCALIGCSWLTVGLHWAKRVAFLDTAPGFEAILEVCWRAILQTMRHDRVFLAYVGVTFGHMDGLSCAKRVAFLDTAPGLVSILEVCCRAVLLTVFLDRVFWVYGGVTWGHKGCIFRHRARSGDHFGGMLKGRFTDSAP